MTQLDRLPTWFKVVLVFTCLYLFMVGIGAMSAAFKLMGSDFSRDLLARGSKAPLVSLFIGILATTLVQSSSASTSAIVLLVANGGIPFESACFMVMGANVGTTVTNTIVSLGHITRTNEYQRAFAAATVHDFFNLMVLLVLFPLECWTGWLGSMAEGATSVFQDVGGTKLANPIKLATVPAIDFLKWVCGDNGAALLTVALVLTFSGLILMVKTLKLLMLSKLENLFDRVIFKNAHRALLFGVVLTILVQSSSITTSVAVPLVGAGIITVTQVFPYTMGANIGTTMTGLLAALGAMASGANPDLALIGLQVAFFHVGFNILGVALMWRFRAIPVAIANRFATMAMRNRAIPIVYIITTFYVIPLLIVWFW